MVSCVPNLNTNAGRKDPEMEEHANRVLPQLRHSTATSAAVDALRTAILSGVFTPGEQLPEIRLSTELGISRAPVREAIAQLVDEGLVVKRAYRGATVADISDSDVADIAEVRKLVEADVMEIALRSEERGSEVRSSLEKSLKEMAAAAATSDNAKSVIAHMEFHRIFYTHCGNSILESMWKSWQGQLQLFFSKDHTVFEDPGIVTMEHEHLLAVLYSGDIDELRREVNRHIHGSVDPNHWNEHPPIQGHFKIVSE